MKYIKNITISLTIATLLIGCGESSSVDIETKASRSVNNNAIDTIKRDALGYINMLRNSAGMIPFSRESHLEKAAENHANYLVNNNLFSHNESSNYRDFTGNFPSDRARFVGYEHTFVGENISSGNGSVKESIDTLFSAIYHRFGFLNFDYDEIGVGYAQTSTYVYGNVYNYNMGLSSLRTLCENSGEISSGDYYQGICLDTSKALGVSDFTQAINSSKYQNPDHVLWPSDNASDIPPVFYEEMPDPLPECSVSGYPVSISFNPLKSGTIMIDSFKLYGANNQEIEDVKLMDKQTDPNHHLTDSEFALFPMHRLEWNSHYHAEISYHDNGRAKHESISFQTASLPYKHHTVERSGVVIKVKSGETTAFYLPPKNCNDKLSTFSATGLVADVAFHDANTILITPKQQGRLDIATSSGVSFIVEVE